MTLWHLIIVWKELENVHYALICRGRDVYILTTVIMHDGAHRISMLPVGRPRASVTWFLVWNDFAPWRSKCCFVVIHEAVKVGDIRELRV
jgi:hypothetical protein